DSYMYGINEMMNMRLWAIADVPVMEGYWFTFRVIDGEYETPGTITGQYDGDFWGLYIAFENYDGAFLERLDLPKGNLYKLSDKIYGGYDQLRYQGEDAIVVTDDPNAHDFINIQYNLRRGESPFHPANPSIDFIRNHLDCDEWYRYHTVIESVRSYDIFSGPDCFHCNKNVAWYFAPPYTAENNYYGKVQFLPFDFDDSWGSYFNHGIDHAKSAIYDIGFEGDHVLEQYPIDPAKSALKQEYRNYIREYRDLLWQEDVIYPMISELASVIADIVPADRDRWRLQPGFDDASRCDPGPLDTIIAGLESFAFQPTNIFAFWPGTSNNLDTLANAENDIINIPNTPTINYIGTAGYPENDLQFETTAFSDPQGNETFAAMKWRIAEVEPATGSAETSALLDQHLSWRCFKGTEQPPSNWKEIGFDDSGWLSVLTSIGYADGDDATVLTDMQNNYSSVYLRNTFTVDNVSEIDSLKLHVYVDDGCIIYINGTEVTRLYCSSGDKYYNSTTETTDHEAPYGSGVYDEVFLSKPYNYLVNGTNVIAVHALQHTLSSTDFSIDVSVTAQVDNSTPSTAGLSKTKYELQATWESDEITTFTSTIRIPADGVTPGDTYRVRCKMKDDTGRWSHWSDPIEFVAAEALGTDLRDHLRITEVMYNNGDAEFIELKNTGTTPLDLSAVTFTNGVTFAFAGSNVESLSAGQYVLLIKNQAAFEDQYGTSLNSLIAGEFVDSSLSNSGENIKLEDNWDGTIVEFEYNDARGWPLAADGAGHSLVPFAAAIDPSQPLSVLNYGGNWRQSTYIGGSPGADDPAPTASIVINEFMAHTDFSDPVNYPEYDSNDWIELYNAGGAAVTLNSDWYLSDDPDELQKWALPAGTLSSGSYISYDEISGFHTPITNGFGLDKAGEQIFLSCLPGTNADRVVDCISFKGQQNDVSLGRYPDGGDHWFSFSPSTQASTNDNNVSHVVIKEFMYHPIDGKEEYVQIHNPTGTSVFLTVTLPNAGLRGWAIDGAVNYEFPSGTPALAADAAILVVGFDPTDTVQLNAFEASYGISGLAAGVNVFGPWSGDLSNGGERLTLEKPQDSDNPLEPLTVSWIIIDECIYNDSWPWPSEPDGTGLALRRVSMVPGVSGNDPANWKANNPLIDL
ncbi:MAG: lamin tail domain-containing protein, partial [Planctomycetota bacterium]